ncbi:MAG: iron donor protein CyaY [Alphaproteobacteria bacterium CG11_big_fil_rev_8_21_14_0_20_44_7]|nr:MAG: iron donor protein CyaY [Alphaproteobacteria bacterium CG11_big_fil_rev_8_21_14_0_20_44_7]
MEETQYHKYADAALEELLEYLEGLEDEYDIYPELESGVLSLTMADDRQYVINKHTPSKQIWVSSPYSGAGYYEYAEGVWQPKRVANSALGKNLREFIMAEVMENLDD